MSENDVKMWKGWAQTDCTPVMWLQIPAALSSYQQSPCGTPQGVFDQTALAGCVWGCGRRKSNGVKTVPCSMCLCTVYFTGDEMSTMVYINLQNNIGKYSLTIWNRFTVRQKNYIEEMPSTLKDKIHSQHQGASTEPCQFTRAEDLPLKSFLHST